jgi:hypothetical protein
MFRLLWMTFGVVSAVIALSGCGGSPNNPSQPPFTGTWVGNYVVLRCVASGEWPSCDAARAEKNVEQVGTTYPLRLSLTQGGSAVTGTVQLAYSNIPVTGAVTGNTLALTGRFDSAFNRAENDSVSITQWTTNGGSNGMAGTFSWRLAVSWGLAQPVPPLHPPFSNALVDYDAQVLNVLRVSP